MTSAAAPATWGAEKLVPLTRACHHHAATVLVEQ
jgi:hypothetical protein